VFFKTESDRASAQAAKARQDAGEAGSNAALGARNLGAAVLATLAEATAPADDRKGKKHAQRARAKAVKAARRDKEAASKAASKAAGHGRKAAAHGRKAADKRADAAGGTLAVLADTASHKVAGAAATAAGTAKVAGSQLAHKVAQAELADKARAQASHVREAAAERSAPLAGSAKEKAAASAAVLAALAAAAREKADETRARALLGVDHGIDVAVPRAQEGVAAVGPRVDHLRDVINHELLPKLQEMLADVQSNKDRLLTEDKGAVAALTGTPKKRRRKGGALIILGLLAAAGAGIAWYLNQQQRQGATDPWASQAGGADPWASRTPTGSSDVLADTTAAGTAGMATATTGTPATDAPHILESEEIDALAADTPATAEEQTPGESPTEEIQQARGSADSSPLAGDVDAGDVDEGHDPQAPRV
jgi:hypothetical protein